MLEDSDLVGVAALDKDYELDEIVDMSEGITEIDQRTVPSDHSGSVHRQV